MARASASTTRTFFVGLGGLGVIALVVLLALTANSGLPGVPTTDVTAAFRNVGASLKVGDDVRENGVRVGRVSSLRYDGRRALATLELTGDSPVHADARAAVADTSALAKKFIELDRGHPQAGPLGRRPIPETRTTNSADLDTVLNVFDPKTRAAMAGTLRQTGGGAAGHSRDLHDLLEHAPSMLGGVGTISSTLASRQADLPALLHQADQLAGTMSGHTEQLGSLVRRAKDTMRAVGADHGRPLSSAIGQLPGTLADASRGFDALDRPLQDTQAALAGLRPAAADLGAATPDLRGVLREARRPLDLVPGVAGAARPALGDATAAVRDARPLAPPVSRALVDVAGPVTWLSSYRSEIVEFARRFESMLSTETAPGVHGARMLPSVDGASVTGGLLPHALEGSTPYPPPGTVDSYRAPSPLNSSPGGH
jgi:phospholipid/cholesterol/gamma-HCH transport system substrate-binding protein